MAELVTGEPQLPPVAMAVLAAAEVMPVVAVQPVY
jgi:hypothetical protein